MLVWIRSLFSEYTGLKEDLGDVRRQGGPVALCWPQGLSVPKPVWVWVGSAVQVPWARRTWFGARLCDHTAAYFWGLDTGLCQTCCFSVNGLQGRALEVVLCTQRRGLRRVGRQAGRPALVRWGLENRLYNVFSFFTLNLNLALFFFLLQARKIVYFKLFPLKSIDRLSSLLEILLRR